MNMKEHLLSALNEQYQRWDALLLSLPDRQITEYLLPGGGTLKDVVAHLWAWQQRSNARLEAALQDREPSFPVWLPGTDPDSGAETAAINASIQSIYQHQPWLITHRNWKESYERLLASAAAVSERDLLDGSRYEWMDGFPLANVLLATYDHHQEHFDQLPRLVFERREDEDR